MNRTKRARGALLALVVAGASVCESGAVRAGPSATEIVVIGTVHTATSRYTARDLIAILERVEPDVILFELPADMMTESFGFR